MTDKCDRRLQPRHLRDVLRDLYLKNDHIRFALIGACITVARSAQAQNVDSAPPRSRFVVAARQLGPVGYRDPFGVMSPDGHWLAYTSDGRLRLTQIAGGGASTLGPPSRVTSIAWLPDSRHIAAFEVEAGNAGWWLFDATSGERRPLWNGVFPQAQLNGASFPVDPRSFREVAWSPDGERVAAVMQTQNGFMLWTGRADGSNGRVEPSDGPLSSPTWMPDGKTVVCLLMSRGSQHVSLPCGTPSGVADPMEHMVASRSRETAPSCTSRHRTREARSISGFDPIHASLRLDSPVSRAIRTRPQSRRMAECCSACRTTAPSSPSCRRAADRYGR